MANYQSLRATGYIDRTDFVIVRRQGDIRDTKIRCVCEARCNNGWMRTKVDERARPFLLPLFRGDATRLTPEAQRIIATWAAMKAMVGEYDESSYVTTHHAHRRYLMDHLSPPPHGWAIWIGNYVRKDWPVRWLSTPFLLLPDKQAIKRKNRRATYYNGTSSTQVIGNLFIQIVRSPMHRFVARWRFALPRGETLFRIWPPTQFNIAWPGGAISDRSAEYIAGAVKELLASIETERVAAGGK